METCNDIIHVKRFLFVTLLLNSSILQSMYGSMSSIKQSMLVEKVVVESLLLAILEDMLTHAKSDELFFVPYLIFS